VHDELPLSAEVSGAEGHFRIDGRGIDTRACKPRRCQMNPILLGRLVIRIVLTL
jgi:hypothetical protein